MIMKKFNVRYQEEVLPKLKEELGIENDLDVPRVEKVVVNMGVAEEANDKEALEKVRQSLALMTGQQPVVCRAKRSIANFSLRAGDPIGLKSTLRGERLGDFLDKLFHVVLPQVKDFRGLSRDSFDGSGNYTIGFEENTVFPELDYDKIDQPRPLEVTIVTSTDSDDEAERLLGLLDAPFEKED